MTQITLDANPEAPGDFALCVAFQNGVASPRSWEPPVINDLSNAGAALTVVVGHLTLDTALETLALNNICQRVRIPIFQNAAQIVDVKVVHGTVSPATQLPLNVDGHPRAIVFDMIYSPTQGITMGAPANMDGQTNQSATGASWRYVTTGLGGELAPVGAVASFTPGACTLSGTPGNWARVSVALE